MKLQLLAPAIFVVLGIFVQSFKAQGQRAIPLQNQAAQPTANTAHPEVEVVEVHNGSGLPAAIHRSSGAFILLLINRTHDPAAAFSVDPASIGDGVVGPNPLLRLTDSAVASSKHRLAALADLPPGEYYVKFAATGKILCRITIE